MELRLLDLFLVLLAGWLAGGLVARFRYPPVLGELLIGIVLGPPLLAILSGGPTLDALAGTGLLVMMLYIGMQTDPRQLGRSLGMGALIAAVGFLAPFGLCYLVVIAYGGDPALARFVGVAAGVTSLATKSRTLADLGLLDTRIGSVILTGSVITDVMSLLVLGWALAAAEAPTVSLAALGGATLRVVTFAAVAALAYAALTRLAPALARKAAAGRTAEFTCALLIGLALAVAAEFAGFHAVPGAFAAGLIVSKAMSGSPSFEGLRTALRNLSLGFLAPIFFVTAGFGVSFHVFQAHAGMLVAVIGAAVAGKVLATAAAVRLCGRSWREAITVGVGMNDRGALGIIVATVGLEQGAIGPDVFSILAFLALFTTLTTPVLLKTATDWMRRRGESGVLSSGSAGEASIGPSLLDPIPMVDPRGPALSG